MFVYCTTLKCMFLNAKLREEIICVDTYIINLNKTLYDLEKSKHLELKIICLYE